MRRSAIAGAVAWLCLAWVVAAQALVFPALTGRVVDQAELLTPADRAALVEKLAGLEAQTTDQLVIVTLKSLQGTTIEDYGYQLGRFWQIGQKGKNNGVLLIVAPNERAVRIEVGYGLEGTLTDAISKFIIETSILPRFKLGDFPGGIKRGTDDIVQVLSGDAEGFKRAAQDSSPNTNGPFGLPLWLLVVLAWTGVGLLAYCAMRGGGMCDVLGQAIFLTLMSGGRDSSSGGSSWSGGGGSFGGGGASGRW